MISCVVNRLISPVSALSLQLEGQQAGTSQSNPAGVVVGIDKKHSDTIVNFLLRMTCQASYL